MINISVNVRNIGYQRRNNLQDIIKKTVTVKSIDHNFYGIGIIVSSRIFPIDFNQSLRLNLIHILDILTVLAVNGYSPPHSDKANNVITWYGVTAMR